MFKVECEGCHAPYQVDERRVPDGGLKMRCPKCGTTFVVGKPAPLASNATPAVFSLGDDPEPAPPSSEGSMPSRIGSVALKTIARTAPPRAFDDAPAVRVPNARSTDPRGPSARSASQAGSQAGIELDIDLPAAATSGADLPAVPSARADLPAARADLPAARVGLPAARVDLPAPRAAPALPKGPPRPPVPKPRASPDLDLPAARSVGVDLPQIRADLQVTALHADLPQARTADLPQTRPADLPQMRPADLPQARPADLPQMRPADLPQTRPADLPEPKGVGGLPERGTGTGPNLPSPRLFSQDAVAAAIDSIAPPEDEWDLESIPPPPAAPMPEPPPVPRAPRPPAAPAQRVGSDASAIRQPSTKTASISFPPADFVSEPPSEPAESFEFDSFSLPPEPPAAGPLDLNLPPASAKTAGALAGGGVTAGGATVGGVNRQAGGGTGFGELEFSFGEDAGDAVGGAAPTPELSPGIDHGDSPSANAPAGDPSADASASDDDMEFGALPQEQQGAEAVAVLNRDPLPASPSMAVPDATARLKKSGATGRIAAGLVALLVVAGGSMEIVTPYGAFARHLVWDVMHAGQYAALLASTIDEARAKMGSDTFDLAKSALGSVDAAQATAPRVRGLIAYGAFLGYLAELRFGAVPEVDAHAKELAARLIAEEKGVVADLARAAQAAAGSELARAEQMVVELEAREPNDPDVWILAGELALTNKDAARALEAFGRAAPLEHDSARTVFGRARAFAEKGDSAAAEVAARQVLAASPNHVGARTLLARVAWTARRDEGAALKALSEITSPGNIRASASPDELVQALTLAGTVHMSRSRMSQAEAALGEALEIDPRAGSALAGMGEVLFRQGRYTDALGRFEGGIKADPEGIVAKIGAAKTEIMLERLQDAKELLRKLRDARPKEIEVAYWLGRAEEALGDKKGAEADYREAVRLGPDRAEAVDAYTALAQLLAAEGLAADAAALLADAKQKLPDVPRVHEIMGEADLTAGRHEDAQLHFARAIELDPDNLSAKFKLAVTLRRMNRFDEALAGFEAVAAIDKNYPGLALERGLLYEASGRSSEALAYYQEALARAPEDADLMLRVGSAEVAAGHAAQAEEILRKVIVKRANSAEVNHYYGRALLLKGTNLTEALRYLKRASEIDPNRPEYHLYVGWAANDAGQQAVAQTELDKALELDRSLADAYWQKGILLRKGGAVVDAVQALNKALALRPSRYEAYATLAECYQDQTRWADAIAAWKKALAGDGKRAEWHYQLGKLLAKGGEADLRQAIVLADGVDVKPAWLAQAYYELAEIERGAGKRQDAIEHYKKFVNLARVDSPFRADAIKALSGLGSPYDGN